MPRGPNLTAAFWSSRFQHWTLRMVLRIGPTAEHQGIRIGTGPADNDEVALKRLSEALNLIAEHDPRLLERMRDYFGGFVVRDGEGPEVVEPTPFGILLFPEHSLCVRGPSTESLACHIVRGFWMTRELGVLPLKRHPHRRAIRSIGALAYRRFALRLPDADYLVEYAEGEVERCAGLVD